MRNLHDVGKRYIDFSAFGDITKSYLVKTSLGDLYKVLNDFNNTTRAITTRIENWTTTVNTTYDYKVNND